MKFLIGILGTQITCLYTSKNGKLEWIPPSIMFVELEPDLLYTKDSSENWAVREHDLKRQGQSLVYTRT